MTKSGWIAARMWGELGRLPRLILGALFLLSAVDGFYFIFTGGRIIHPPTSARGEEFEGALIASGFFWPLLKTVNLVGALCLLTNRAPAFGFALIVPVITVIVLFHLFLNPQGLPMAAVMVVCSLLLPRAYWPQSGCVPQSGLQGRDPARAAGAIRLH